MQKSEQLAAWKQTVEVLNDLLAGQTATTWMDEYEKVLHQSEMSNPWFTKE